VVDDVSELVRFLRDRRAENRLTDQPFDIVLGGASQPGTLGWDLVSPLADAGSPGGMDACRGTSGSTAPNRSSGGSTKAQHASDLSRTRSTCPEPSRGRPQATLPVEVVGDRPACGFAHFWSSATGPVVEKLADA
jgi:hypothetical protein